MAKPPHGNFEATFLLLALVLALIIVFALLGGLGN